MWWVFSAAVLIYLQSGLHVTEPNVIPALEAAFQGKKNNKKKIIIIITLYEPRATGFE
jgi:hypothetical protein